jgi:starch synthase
LNWVPDIIHVHGWMAAMLPIYMKHYYKNEALFSDTKIVTCLQSIVWRYFRSEMIKKINWTKFLWGYIWFKTPDYESIIKTTIKHSDAVIIATDSLSPSLTKFIESSGKPFTFVPKMHSCVYSTFTITRF